MSESTVGFALAVGHLPAKWLTVQSFEGVEGLSRLHNFKIRVETPIPAIALDALALGSTATFGFRSSGHTRHVHGIISSIRREDSSLPAAPSHAVFTLTLVPHAWLLTRRRGSRIFQDVSIVEVIDNVLSTYDLPHTWHLATPRPKRPYITQYEESDWEFVCRLAAENGIFFHFAHPEIDLDPIFEALLASTHTSDAEALVAELASFAFDTLVRARDARETMTFCDHAEYLPIDGITVPFLHAGASAPGHDYVSKFVSRRSIRSTTTTFTEFDWRRPLSKIESAVAQGPSALLSQLARPGEPPDLEVYEHRARDHEPDWEDSALEATRMLQVARRKAVRFSGEANSARLVPGRSLVLEGHSIEEGVFAVTKIRHQGSRRPGVDRPTAYANRFEAVPVTVAYLPRPPGRPNVQACLTAIVAGREGQEIHVNESGQIKVKFHWDRRDEKASPTCWLRCMHPWAGNGWGFQFIPRVGMEVVIGFEGGDPDRPLVLGTVYNAVQPEPFTLPQHATRSGIRTKSTPNSSGFNELSFEDRADEEQIFLRAQRDWDAFVQRDRTVRVGRDDHENIEGEQQIAVGGNQTLRVTGDQDIRVGGAVTEETVGSHEVQRLSLISHILEERTDYIDGTLETHVRGARAHHTHRWQVDRVDGNSTHLVGHGASGGNWAVDVRGQGSINSSRRIDITADEEIMLRAGNSFVRIGPDGVEIGGLTTWLRGRMSRIEVGDIVDIYSQSKVQVVGDRGVILKSTMGASLGLQTQAAIAGSQVLLNSPSQATDSLEERRHTRTTVTVRDQDGHALPFQLFHVLFDDGTMQTGVTDSEGNATVEGEGEGHIYLNDHANPEEG